MAIRNLTGFETGDAVELFVFSGTISVQSTVKRTGGYALRFNPTTTATGVAGLWGLGLDGTVLTGGGGINSANLYFRGYFRVDTLPTSGSEEILAFRTSALAYKAALRINDAGNLEVYDSTGTNLVATGSTVLSTSTFYRINMLVGTGASASYELKINGVSELSGTLDATTTNNGLVYLGKGTNRNGQTIDCFWDDCILDDASEPGAGQVEVMLPDATGNYTAWSDGAGTAPSNVAGIPHDSDTGYIASSTATEAETQALESGASAGVSGTVNVVKSVCVVRDEGGSSSLDVRIRSGSTDADSNNSDPGSSYVARCRPYATDPATGAAWVLSALDSVECGVLNNNNVAVRCTLSCVMVDFTPAAATGNPWYAYAQQ